MRYTQPAADGARSTGTRARIVSPTLYVVVVRARDREAPCATRGAGGGENGHRVACISEGRRRLARHVHQERLRYLGGRAGEACTTLGRAFRSATMPAARSTSFEACRPDRSKRHTRLRVPRTRALRDAYASRYTGATPARFRGSAGIGFGRIHAASPRRSASAHGRATSFRVDA